MLPLARSTVVSLAGSNNGKFKKSYAGDFSLDCSGSHSGTGKSVVQSQGLPFIPRTEKLTKVLESASVREGTIEEPQRGVGGA